VTMVQAHIARPRLGAYALFAALLSGAGLPLYIHAPKFYVDSYGVGLTAMAAVLFGLRLLDVVQDPLLGWLADRLRAGRGLAIALAVAILAGAMLGLFAVAPPIPVLAWFGLMLALVFSSFSFLTICFYAQGVAKADALGDGGHLRVARWRETGALLGICAASIAPVALGVWLEAPFVGFAIGFAMLALIAGRAMAAEWDSAAPAQGSGLDGFRAVLGDAVARRLLLVAFLNAAPVAVSSTLFLFFVESRLQAPGWEGPMLLLFFAAAAVAAPIWGKLAEHYGAQRTLMAGMVLSIFAFGGALTLGAGDVAVFAAICLMSGAALGADMTLLPALFAARLARVAPTAGAGFGLWSFLSKLTLAFAAITLLPTLEAAGFHPQGGSSDRALWMLSLAYAGLPCLLKLGAIFVLARTNLKEI